MTFSFTRPKHAYNKSRGGNIWIKSTDALIAKHNLDHPLDENLYTNVIGGFILLLGAEQNP